jgi:hypothetical protein
MKSWERNRRSAFPRLILGPVDAAAAIKIYLRRILVKRRIK